LAAGSKARLKRFYQRLSTPPERMAGFIELLRERHGGAEQFFLSQGTTPETIAAVRRNLTA